MYVHSVVDLFVNLVVNLLVDLFADRFVNIFVHFVVNLFDFPNRPSTKLLTVSRERRAFCEKAFQTGPARTIASCRKARLL